MSIIGKVVVITGASSGIGEATARLLAKKGAKVVLGARREDKLQKIVESIVNAGGEAMYLVTDVVKQEDNERLVQLAKKHFGKNRCYLLKCRNYAKFTSFSNASNGMEAVS